tara:strand:+ start:94 stop:279 length:186 start_codon:yes stop_codon:yes gene_type:complete
MSLTEEQLDVIEAVKGRREAGLWDNRCEKYMNKQKKAKPAIKKPLETKTSEEKAEKVDSTS